MFATVTIASVFVLPMSWDADAEDDGVVVFPSLEDDAGDIVEWQGPILPVDVGIWTTAVGEDYLTRKDKLVYRGSGMVDSWEDGNMFMGGGIRMPFEQMTVPPEVTAGWTFASAHTLDGRTFEGFFKLTLLTSST